MHCKLVEATVCDVWHVFQGEWNRLNKLLKGGKWIHTRVRTHTRKHTPLFTMSTMDIGQELVGATMLLWVQMCLSVGRSEPSILICPL